MRDRFTWATAPGSWASSEEVSWRSRRSPFFTGRPASKAISTTLPASSADTVTPCTAFSVPTAVRAVSHDSAFTTRGGHGLGRRYELLALVDHRTDLQGLDGDENDDDDDQTADSEYQAFLHVCVLPCRKIST